MNEFNWTRPISKKSKSFLVQSPNTIFKNFFTIMCLKKLGLNNENTTVIKNLRFNSIRFRGENSFFFFLLFFMRKQFIFDNFILCSQGNFSFLVKSLLTIQFIVERNKLFCLSFFKYLIEFLLRYFSPQFLPCKISMEYNKRIEYIYVPKVKNEKRCVIVSS